MTRTLLVLALAVSLTGGPVTAQSADDPSATAPPPDPDRTDVAGAIVDSMKLLLIEHGMRLGFQAKTRRELEGSFWGDYRIWLDHGPDENAPIRLDTRYLGSRARAAAFSAVYSLQFEIGPLSEASIGNVGMRPDTSGWVDHVVTPAGAFAFMVVQYRAPWHRPDRPLGGN